MFVSISSCYFGSIVFFTLFFLSKVAASALAFPPFPLFFFFLLTLMLIDRLQSFFLTRPQPCALTYIDREQFFYMFLFTQKRWLPRLI
ncbi:hypothetical protein NC653_001967 [Populus alba x Populus x berolinensis]|uniref:Uncharacterized protein n=1 Tax=Populus alba x Populus x berolinensis TaxID=444605 RepID=A0AAD6RMW3_9ROSI|nr:hypothetical protein NC653_001967 [Populus alba x Populus x berolinensis]